MKNAVKNYKLVIALVAVALVAGVAGAQQIDPNNINWDNVKQIWSSLSPQEQAAYMDIARQQAAANPGSRSFGGSRAPSDLCEAATKEIGGLPYVDSSTTVGLVDDYDLDASGACAAGGSQFGGTGEGPDIAYVVSTDVTCDVNVNMDPAANDLSLYVVTDCANLAATCLGVDDAGGGGTAEDVGFVAAPGTDYFIIVDGFSGSSDAFDLTITEIGATGCALVPVQLTGFDVE